MSLLPLALLAMGVGLLALSGEKASSGPTATPPKGPGIGGDASRAVWTPAYQVEIANTLRMAVWGIQPVTRGEFPTGKYARGKITKAQGMPPPVPAFKAVQEALDGGARVYTDAEVTELGFFYGTYEPDKAWVLLATPSQRGPFA